MKTRGFRPASQLLALILITLPLLRRPALSQPNPNCDPTELKKQLKAAEEKETESKKVMQDRQKDLAFADGEIRKLLGTIPAEASGLRTDGTNVSSSDVERAIKKYNDAFAAYDRAVDKYNEDIANGVAHDKAQAELKAAKVPRENAANELLALINGAAEYEKKQQTDREKEIQAALTKNPAPDPKKELQTLYPKKDQPPPEREPGSRLEYLPGTMPKSKLQRLGEMLGNFEPHEALYDEESSEFSIAYADYKKTYDLRVALQAKLQKLEEDCAEKPKIDTCLIGTWECVYYKENNEHFTGGGTGFRVTFKGDGTEIVDYSSMQPIRFAGTDILSFEGKASAKISTKDGVAKIEQMLDADASFHMVVRATGTNWKPKIPGLGGGGLGEVKGNNTYECTEETLEYQVSGARDLHPTGTVKLHRVRE